MARQGEQIPLDTTLFALPCHLSTVKGQDYCQVPQNAVFIGIEISSSRGCGIKGKVVCNVVISTRHFCFLHQARSFPLPQLQSTKIQRHGAPTETNACVRAW